MNKPADGRFYADGATVFRRPRERENADGSTRITMGFPVCEVSEYLDAEILAAVLNQAIDAGILDD